MSATALKQKLREVVGVNANLPLQATVTKVQTETCSVKLDTGLELDDIRLKAAINSGTDFLMLRPKVGSKVLLLSMTGTLEDLAIIKIDQVKNIELKQGGMEILADAADGKVKIKNSGADFKEILDDLSALLKGFKVFTPSGPSGTPLPPVLAKINAFETKYKKLFK